MKITYSIVALAVMGAVIAEPPPHARGPYRRFEVTPGGDAAIQLVSDGPTIHCKMNPGRGNANPRSCQSGFTYVTMVDAECPPNLFNNPNKECFAASVVEGATGKIFNVNSAGEVIERHTDDYPDEEHPPNEDAPPEEHSDMRSLRGESKLDIDRSLQEPETPVIDVMVVYTQGAKADAQNYGDGPIENLVNLAIAETNAAYVNSGINLELNLIHLEEDLSGYADDIGSSSMSPSLYHLTYTAGHGQDPDGKLDYVHTMRENVGADMVALITTGAGCGIAWLSGNCQTCNPTPNNQFSVTKYSCATGYFSFGHELGHNMGAHHDKGTTNTCGSTDYRYGFRDPNGQYRSILSYSCATGQCDSNPGGSCTRSPFFSNPDPAFTWNGGPMGWGTGTAIGETNNARRIGEKATVIAAFKDSGTTASPTDPVTPNPTKSPVTPGPTKSPVTSGPTKSPVTPGPTKSPVTPNPTAPPTSSPTKSPVPPTPPPTKSPSTSPTPSPTKAPTPSVPKYICQKWEPAQGEICASGTELDGTCQIQGESCRNGGKSCWIEPCSSSGPPSPTPPTPTPGPPTSCPVCGDGNACCPSNSCPGDGTLCGTCQSGGKPSERTCV